VEHRMIYQALHQGLPSAMGDYGTSLVDAGAEWRGLLRRLQEGAARFLEDHWAPSFRGFRTAQYASYLALFVCLLLALSGDAGLYNVFERPSWYFLVGLASALIQTLFSPKGFAALGSYFLLQTLLGLRFYGRYKKLLQRHAQKFIESLKLELDRMWEEELDSLINHLTEEIRQIEGRVSALSALRGAESEDWFMPFKLLLLAIVLLLPMVPTFWAILDIPKRRFASTKKKIIWFLVVATLPVLGAIFYITLGRRHTHPLQISQS
jgi:hypothetical protein